MPIILIRPARDTDLAQIYDVFYENEVGDLPTALPPGDVPSDLRHTLATGTMHVAEQDGPYSRSRRRSRAALSPS